MDLRLDFSSPVPLYHQIAEGIRYAIATGRIVAGDTLPPVRLAGSAWGVNLHTVRRGYAELAGHGLIEICPPHPARVLGADALSAPSAELARFADSVVAKASSRYGLSAMEFAGLLAQRGAPASTKSSPVRVVECSDNQCVGHARELERHWGVRAEPWSLQQLGEPPPGEVVATFFHYNDIRRRWPHRLYEIHFAAIQPDPGLRRKIDSQVAAKGTVSLQLCEFNETMTKSIAADLSVLLPAKRYRLRTAVIKEAGERLTERGRSLVLFPPRAWAALTEAQRAHPKAVEVRYVFAPGEIEEIGQHFGWHRRRHVA
jgi:DNA-binding transcriptional regulator YhcF (GntR family)